MTDKYEEGWRAAADASDKEWSETEHLKGTPERVSACDQAAISVLRERFVPRVEGPHDALIERLGHASAGLRSHFKPGAIELIPTDTMDEAAATLASLQAEVDAYIDAARAALEEPKQ